MAAVLHLKLHLPTAEGATQIRRIGVPVAAVWADVLRKANELFHTAAAEAAYCDADGDRVIVSSQEEWEECRALCPGSFLQLHIQPLRPHNASPTLTGGPSLLPPATDDERAAKRQKVDGRDSDSKASPAPAPIPMTPPPSTAPPAVPPPPPVAPAPPSMEGVEGDHRPMAADLPSEAPKPPAAALPQPAAPTTTPQTVQPKPTAHRVPAVGEDGRRMGVDRPPAVTKAPSKVLESSSDDASDDDDDDDDNDDDASSSQPTEIAQPKPKPFTPLSVPPRPDAPRTTPAAPTGPPQRSPTEAQPKPKAPPPPSAGVDGRSAPVNAKPTAPVLPPPTPRAPAMPSQPKPKAKPRAKPQAKPKPQAPKARTPGSKSNKPIQRDNQTAAGLGDGPLCAPHAVQMTETKVSLASRAAAEGQGARSVAVAANASANPPPHRLSAANLQLLRMINDRAKSPCCAFTHSKPLAFAPSKLNLHEEELSATTLKVLQRMKEGKDGAGRFLARSKPPKLACDGPGLSW
eukprot:TRINITY_DN5329_c0_g1_i1.p1 TRINITY_DN5329_c0_g1~~TRINITY_DN5329_c0_g1_i1.p1  ORF type:complete len:525 (-),score=49.87 TRINITY_DN5329_c0_g1_i1:189-1739(-)